MHWLELEHSKISKEEQQYEYRSYFSRVVYYICYKLKLLDDDQNKEEEEEEEEEDDDV